jgi:DNA-binding NarL/FixJ family response regulator
VGYLLKDRVSAVEEFRDALLRVAAGGTALDPEVVAQLLGRPPGSGSCTSPGPLDRLSEREREVLSLMAEGRTNTAIARALFVTPSAVEKHIAAIFTKLHLPSTAAGHHRRVLAVLTHLGRTPERQREAPVNGEAG